MQSMLSVNIISAAHLGQGGAWPSEGESCSVFYVFRHTFMPKVQLFMAMHDGCTMGAVGSALLAGGGGKVYDLTTVNPAEAAVD